MTEKEKQEFKNKLEETGYAKVFENYQSGVYGKEKAPIIEAWFLEQKHKQEAEKREQDIELVKIAVKDLSGNIKFTAGEIAVFKEALCGIAKKMNKSSSKMLWVTVALVLITLFYAWQTKQTVNEMRRSRKSQEEGYSQYISELQKSRESQEKGFEKYVKELQNNRKSEQENVKKYITELQKARKEEIKPNIYALFYYSNNLGKYFVVVQNVGVGPAFDIEVSYPAINTSGEKYNQIYKCPVLPAGKETVDSSPFTIDGARKVNPITISIKYKNSFGDALSNTYEHTMSPEQPVPTEFSERRRELENEIRASDIRDWFRIFNSSIDDIKKELYGIKEAIKK